MRNSYRRWILALLAAAALFAVPAAGCLQEAPYEYPQPMPSEGPGPQGTAAFLSGEASKTGLKPVKEGARTSADAVGGADSQGTTDTVVDAGASGTEDVRVEFDFGF